jgi:hypothetical protein
MSAMMGLKAARRIYSLGTKLHVLHSLGKKLGKLASDHSSHTVKGVSTDSSVGVNNMIYNKSNLGDAQYLPFGVRKLVGHSTKKSYLEKR